MLRKEAAGKRFAINELIEFIDQNGGGPGMRLRKRPQKEKLGGWQKGESPLPVATGSTGATLEPASAPR
jgi:hypothetical protein